MPPHIDAHMFSYIISAGGFAFSYTLVFGALSLSRHIIMTEAKQTLRISSANATTD